MRRAWILLGAGLCSILVQSVLSLHLPQGFVPDLGFLVVIVAGLHLTAASGVVVASLLGYATDLFSGALLGQHALLRALTFAVTRLANRRLDLRQPIPLACLVAALTVLDAAGVMALTRLFAGRVAIDGDLLLLLGAQVLVNAVAAPMMSASMRGLLDWTAHDEGLRRTVRLAPRPPIP